VLANDLGLAERRPVVLTPSCPLCLLCVGLRREDSLTPRVGGLWFSVDKEEVGMRYGGWGSESAAETGHFL
jgi:hypothetical protein